ncbi:hypothetical protein C8Q75DRAFT_810198 [Abortiporus biennis]|nr:hypothetical protein C8Q75DRAFT_810198 [Abortiporus biennis]
MCTILEASQLDTALHSPALLEMLQVEVTKSIIDYVVECTYETVTSALSRTNGSSAPSIRHSEVAEFSKLVTQVIHRAKVQMPVILATVVYIKRARKHLEVSRTQYALERTFLGALIVANKFLNDSTLKNIHWSRASGIFRTREITRMEREFLAVLDFQLSITEEDILEHHSSIVLATRSSSASLYHRITKRISWSSESSTTTCSSPSTPSTRSPTPPPPSMVVPSQSKPSRPTSFILPDNVSVTQSTTQRSSVPERAHRRHHSTNPLSSALHVLRSIPSHVSLRHHHYSPKQASESHGPCGSSLSYRPTPMPRMDSSLVVTAV